jgi:hypothetical protein
MLQLRVAVWLMKRIQNGESVHDGGGIEACCDHYQRHLHDDLGALWGHNDEDTPIMSLYVPVCNLCLPPFFGNEIIDAIFFILPFLNRNNGHL